MSVLRLVGMDPGIPIVTPVCLYRCDPGQWEAQPTGGCAWCGRRFEVPQLVMDAIDDIAGNESLSPGKTGCLDLAPTAWKDPRLLFACPHCRQPLQFNPFFVHQADGWPIVSVTPADVADESADAAPLRLRGRALPPDGGKACEDLIKRGLERINAAQQRFEREGRRLTRESIADFDKGLADLDRAAHTPTAQARQAEGFLHQAKTNYLLIRANDAAEREDWDSAIDLLRGGLKIREGSPQVFREALAVSLANRAVRKVQRAVDVLSRGAGPQALTSGLADLETAEWELTEASRNDPSNDNIKTMLGELRDLTWRIKAAQAAGSPLSQAGAWLGQFLGAARGRAGSRGTGTGGGASSGEN